MKQSIFETGDKLSFWGRSFYVIEVFYSERMDEHIYVLEDKHVDGRYETLSESVLVICVDSAAEEDSSGVDAFFDFIDALTVDDTSDA